mgnify:CR=1 FL=1
MDLAATGGDIDILRMMLLRGADVEQALREVVAGLRIDRRPQLGRDRERRSPFLGAQVCVEQGAPRADRGRIVSVRVDPGRERAPRSRVVSRGDRVAQQLEPGKPTKQRGRR